MSKSSAKQKVEQLQGYLLQLNREKRQPKQVKRMSATPTR